MFIVYFDINDPTSIMVIAADKPAPGGSYIAGTGPLPLAEAQQIAKGAQSGNIVLRPLEMRGNEYAIDQTQPETRDVDWAAQAAAMSKYTADRKGDPNDAYAARAQADQQQRDQSASQSVAYNKAGLGGQGPEMNPWSPQNIEARTALLGAGAQVGSPSSGGMSTLYDDQLGQYGLGGVGGTSPIPTGEFSGWMAGMDPTSPLMGDPDYMVDSWLNSQGMPNHANRGYLENAYEAWAPLNMIMNPGGMGPSADEVALNSGNFIGGLNNSTGGDFVDTRQVWDQMLSPEYGGFASQVTQASDQQGQSQYDLIMSNIGAMSQWMGPTASGIAQSLVQQAWFDYNQQGLGSRGVTFVDYLRAQGAENWF